MPSEHSDLVVSRQDDFIASHSATVFNKNQVPGPANVYHAPDSDAESSSTVTTDSNSSVTTVDWEKFWAAVNEMNAPVASFIGKMWNGFREDVGGHSLHGLGVTVLRLLKYYLAWQEARKCRNQTEQQYRHQA